jgi:hypothetical protein
MNWGRAAIGSSTAVEKNWLPSEVNSRGAVSPAARAIASMMPVRIPGAAIGSTTLQVVRQRGAPSDRAASFCATGTRRRISSVDRTTIGNMMMPIATPPASAEKCPWTTTRPR